MGLGVVDSVRRSFRPALTSAVPDCGHRRLDGDSVRHGDVARSQSSSITGKLEIISRRTYLYFYFFNVIFEEKKTKKQIISRSMWLFLLPSPILKFFFFFLLSLICNYLCV